MVRLIYTDFLSFSFFFSLPSCSRSRDVMGRDSAKTPAGCTYLADELTTQSSPLTLIQGIARQPTTYRCTLGVTTQQDSCSSLYQVASTFPYVLMYIYTYVFCLFIIFITKNTPNTEAEPATPRPSCSRHLRRRVSDRMRTARPAQHPGGLHRHAHPDCGRVGRAPPHRRRRVVITP